MADASYLQTSFLGGEWSPLVQGRQDDPRYRSGMNVCRNILPLEEGSGGRRPGTRLIGPTRKGAKAVLRAFDFEQSHPYNLELTAGHLRFLAGAGIVVESAGEQGIKSLNAANPVVIETPAVHTWATGDQVIVGIKSGEVNATIAALLGRQLEITVTDTTHFSVADAVTGTTIDGTSMVLGSTDLTVTRIADFVTPYAEADLQAINQVQDQTDLLLLHNSYPPEAILSSRGESGADLAVFSISPAVFLDGPYLDPPTDGTTITSSGLTGSVTLTLAGGSTRFVSTDVGRLVRLFSEPATWSSASSYAVNDQVKFNGEYYQAIKANSNKQPDADVVNWGVATGAALWTWAQITAFTSGTVVTATIKGANILRTTACVTWRLGLFSQTTGYPSCGTYHEGRLWLAGVLGNRIDGSKSNDFFNFEPTSADGTVADDNAIDAVFNAKDVNQIYWMEPDERGIIAGTQAGEWIVQASQQNDPLTPTSIQAHRRTNYGCANVPPKRTGATIAFVQRFGKKLLEYITTDFRGLSAHNIALTGKHLTQKGLVEIAYQSEKVPTIWARTADGALISCTYKRESPYASDPPVFAGWARHDLGSGMTVESIQAGPNFDGTLDALSIVVSDGTHRWTTLLTDLFDVDWTIGDAMFVDFAETPSMWEVITGPPKLLRLYSLHYLAGKSVDVFAGGIDCGTLVVAADGHLDIPIDSVTVPLLTSTWLASLTTSNNFHGLGLAITATAAGVGNVPAVTGIQNFDSSLIATRFDAAVDIDWTGKRLFVPDASHGKLLVLNTDTFKPIAGPFTANIQGPFKYAEDGYLYSTTLGTNVAILHRINPATGADMATFGLGSASFATTATTWAYPNDMDTVSRNSGKETYLVSTALNHVQTTNEVTVLNLGHSPLVGMSWTGFNFHLDEANGVVCRGLEVNNLGQAFILAGDAAGVSVGLYVIQIAALGTCTFRKIATIPIGTLVPTWTQLSSIYGMVLDETDGGVIVQVSNVADVRLVKLNTHTGAVVWNVALNSTLTAITNWNSSRCRYGRLNYIEVVSPNCKLHSIATATGTDTVSGLLGALIGPGPQFTDDFTGNIYFNGQFAFSGSPARIGTTPANFNDWATLGPAAGPATPAAAPPTAGVFWTTPVAIGYTYPSQGQILRAIAPAESGAQNGPALGKTRRTHMYSALLQQAQGVKFGTDFSSMRPAQLRSKGGIPYALTSLFSAVHQDTLQDDYSFDSMLCWEIDRPYPATVCTLGAFLHTQDR